MKFLIRYSDLLRHIDDCDFVAIFQKIISSINKIYILIDTQKFDNIDVKKRGKIARKYENRIRKMGFPFHRVILDRKDEIFTIMEYNHFDVLLTSNIQDMENLKNNEFMYSINLNNDNYEINNSIECLLKRANEPLMDSKTKLTNRPSEDKIWLKYYNQKALQDLKRYSFNNSSIFEHICTQNADFLYDVAIDYYGNLITYDDLKNNVLKYQRAFIELGLKAGDKVSICTPNVPDGIYSYFAIQNIGAIPSLMHVFTKANEMKKFFQKEETKFIVMIGMQETYQNIDLAIKDNPNIKKVVVVPLNNNLLMHSFESIKTRLGIYVLSSKMGKFLINSKKILEKYKTNENGKYKIYKKGILFELWNLYMSLPNNFKMPKDDRYIIVKDFLENGKNTPLVKSYNDISTIIHTGGTTGIGKSTLLTHKNVNRSDDAFEATIQNFEKGDTIITIPPLFHILGLNNCIALILRNGGKIVLISKYRKKDLPALFKKHHPELLFGVPKIGKDIISVEGFRNVDLSDLKYYVLGGEEMSKKIIDESSEFLKNHGAKIDVSQSLGGTEGTCSYTNTFNNCNVHGSVGIPLINVTAKIVNIDENGIINEVNYNEYGEICFHGDTIMAGYLKDEEANLNALRKHKDGKVWLHTGDCGYINEDGLLFFVDRMKDMFKINGEQVFPSEIKKVILQHNAVKDCVALCVDDDYSKKKIVAVITLNENFVNYNHDIIKSEIMCLCKTNLQRESVPQMIDIRDSLLETNLFKVDTKKMTEEYQQKTKRLIKSINTKI